MKYTLAHPIEVGEKTLSEIQVPSSLKVAQCKKLELATETHAQIIELVASIYQLSVDQKNNLYVSDAIEMLNLCQDLLTPKEGDLNFEIPEIKPVLTVIKKIKAKAGTLAYAIEMLELHGVSSTDIAMTEYSHFVYHYSYFAGNEDRKR